MTLIAEWYGYIIGAVIGASFFIGYFIGRNDKTAPANRDK